MALKQKMPPQFIFTRFYMDRCGWFWTWLAKMWHFFYYTSALIILFSSYTMRWKANKNEIGSFNYTKYFYLKWNWIILLCTLKRLAFFSFFVWKTNSEKACIFSYFHFTLLDSYVVILMRFSFNNSIIEERGSYSKRLSCKSKIVLNSYKTLNLYKYIYIYI